MKSKKNICKLFLCGALAILLILTLGNYLKKNTDTKKVKGQWLCYKYYDRKLAEEDFFEFDYNTTFAEMVEKVGEPNGRGGFGGTWYYYELSNGNFIICTFHSKDMKGELKDAYLDQLMVANRAQKKYTILAERLMELSEEEKENTLLYIEQAEMNVILRGLGIKEWDSHAKRDTPEGALIGKDSEEKLKQYTDRDIKVDIEYYTGGHREDGGFIQALIQMIWLSENGQPIYFGYEVWDGKWLANEGMYMMDGPEEMKTVIPENNGEFFMEKARLSDENLSIAINTILSQQKEMRKAKTAWTEVWVWGIDEEGRYICVYITARKKWNSIIYFDPEDDTTKHYYVMADISDRCIDKIEYMPLQNRK